MEEGRGPGARLQKELAWGWSYQAGEQSELWGPGLGLGGRAGEGHPFQLSFPVIRTPGVGGELPVSTGRGASAGCSPSGKVPTKRGVWRCS